MTVVLLAAWLAAGNAIVCDDAAKRVYEADRRADAAWLACATSEAVKAHQREVRAATLRALGGFPERTPLNAKTTGRVKRDGYVIEKVMFESRPNLHVTANLFLPDPEKFPGRRPAVVVPCGHSMNGKASAAYQRGCVKAARKGIVALVYDPIDQGERRQSRNGETLWNCAAHNNVGVRAELLGGSAATFRVWDGIRALDYLETRPEVDVSRLGAMGHSGGGTMTSWLMCLDDRVRCAAPSGFLSTQRAVCRECGPQDAEQFPFGTLAFGFNHLSHIALRAPSPVLHCASHGDFFPFTGVLDTADAARRVYATLGAGDAYALSDVTGPHAWHESTSSCAVDWMDRWLQGATPARTPADCRALDYGFEMAKADSGLSYAAKSLADMRTNRWEASVTPTGSTLDLPGERTVYDVMAETAARQKAARPPLTPERVRERAGIRRASEISWTRFDGGIVADDGTPIPMATAGEGEGEKEKVLFVSDRAAVAGAAALPSATVVPKGGAVTVADLRGYGATAKGRHRFYGCPDGDEEIARLYALVGVNLVAKRAEDVIAAAQALGGGVKLVAQGFAAIPAAHAYYTARDLFSGIELVDPPSGWAALFADDAKRWKFADVVYNAWSLYDWPDLVAQNETTTFAAAESVWPAGLEKEMNTFVEFRAAFDAKAGDAPVLKMAAWYSYRVTLPVPGGELVYDWKVVNGKRETTFRAPPGWRLK